MKQEKSEKQYALVGFPLGHSVSPVIHRALLERAGIRGEYRLLETPSDALEACRRDTLCHLDGFNVTIPYKTAIIPLLDDMSERAKLYGAVNTVAFTETGAKGFNTDCIGFLRSLESARIPLSGSVLVLGCGGVSRMFAFESALAGCRVTLAVRESSLPKAQLLQRELREKTGVGAQALLLGELTDGYDLIVNGTPVGMTPNEDACPLPEAVISRSGAVFDAVYNPAETRLLRLAGKHGLRRAGGLEMLVRQAAAAQEIWNGITFDEDTVNGIVKELEASL